MSSPRAAATYKKLVAMADLKANIKRDAKRLQDAYLTMLSADLPTQRRLFAKVNERLDFDRDTSPATVEQLSVLRRREKRYFGTAQSSLGDRYTWGHVEAMIRELDAALAEGRDEYVEPVSNDEVDDPDGERMLDALGAFRGAKDLR